MRRSRTYPVTPAPQHRQASERNEGADRSVSPIAVAGETSSHTAALVRNIASFLTLSDAASLVSFMSPAESWAVGVELDASGEGTDTTGSWWGLEIETPLTPALVALSPGATPRVPNDQEDDDDASRRLRRNNSSSLFAEDMEELLQERRRRWAQEKITAAVFSHPRSLRSYCWEAYMAAKEIQMQKEEEWAALQHYRISLHEDGEAPPEMQVEPLIHPSSGIGGPQQQILLRKRKRLVTGILDWRSRIVHEVVDWIFSNVPVSVLLDLLEATGFLILDTTAASLHITITTLQHAVAALGRLVCSIWDTVTHCVTNPFQVLEAIISLQFNAMGKTSEVLVSGIQSVATGVESASNMALYRLSATAHMSSSVSTLTGGHHSMPSDGKSAVFNKRLLHKLSSINNAALVVDYRESEEDHCGLTRHAVSRTRRMMHYSVSLRPFVATVTMNPTLSQQGASEDGNDSFTGPAASRGDHDSSFTDLQRHNSFSSGSLDADGGLQSPFMCTPQSFPPTPHSRQMVIAQRSQLSDDVVFLARSRLRVHDGLASDNARTRERSQVQEETKRWAVFASVTRESGIELTCGKHIATKCGGLFYASARSMVAVLRNCFVYFEFTVLPRPIAPALATLAIGLSTEEMPPNTLVGAWPSSVGLCTTGQILMAGQWCSPADPAQFAYGVGSTVGCLVCVDEEKSLETWDGVMVHASIRLNVNGITVTPPVSILPTSGPPGSSLPMTSAVAVGASVAHTGVVGAVGNGGGERVSPSPLTTQGRLELPQSTLTLLVPSTEELYPTVTLQSPATSVVCRFSSEDVLASTREVMGAPPGVAVYAIDGSVILNENEDASS